MDILALALSLTLPLQGGHFTGDFALDVTPVFAIPADTMMWGAAATTLPGVVLYDPDQRTRFSRHGRWEEALHEELRHSEQQAALGPSFWLAYGLTLGQVFEPYSTTGDYAPLSTGAGDDSRYSLDRMWMPEEEMRGRFPLLRLSRDDGGTQLQLLPGYPGVTLKPL